MRSMRTMWGGGTRAGVGRRRACRAVGTWRIGRAVLALVAVSAPPLWAQGRDSIPGVALGLMYETTSVPALGIKPFTGRFGGAGVAPQVEAIIGRDLHNSDRFDVMDSLPASVVGGQKVDYSLWDQLGAVWLVTGQVEGAGGGFTLITELHNVVYAQVKQRGRFPIPDPSDPGFRMAVHRVSDQIVQWVTGDHGVAATRIAFAMSNGDGTKDIYLVDSDGENLRRVTHDNAIDLSPAWSPSGDRIVYGSLRGNTPSRLYVVDPATGQERAVPPVDGDAMQTTPTFAPDGRTLAFTVDNGKTSRLYTYDLDRNCCATAITDGHYYDLAPTYSPDGSQIAFNTMRFGTTEPQIMIMPATGGDAALLSPYQYGNGGYYTSPDWSPTGNLIAFHGRVRPGTYHILVADMKDAGHRLRQLTWEGNNEDPTWGPDGRHLAFVGERAWGFGLMVVDVATGRLRTVLAGVKVSTPAWSPSLGAAPKPTKGGAQGLRH
jgi:TolB protein